MTTFSELRLRAEAAGHDLSKPIDVETGVASTVITGGEQAARNAVRKVYEIAVEADAAAGTTIAERPELGFPASEFPSGVKVVGIGFRSVAVTPHADNHYTDTFTGRDRNGANNLSVATLTSDADVAVGSGGLGAGATTASKVYAALLNTTPANLVIPAGGVLTLTRAKGGTGVQLGRTHYTVVVEAL